MRPNRSLPILAALLLTTSVACKKKPAPAPEPPAATPKPAAQVEGSCPAATKLTVTSKNGAYPKDKPIDWSTIKDSVAYLRKSYGVSSAHIYLGNLDIPDLSLHDLIKHRLADGQGMVNLTVIRQPEGQQKDVPLVNGPYDPNGVQGKQERIVAAAVVVAGGTSVTLRTGEIKGTFEITRAGPREICGKLSLKDPWTTIAGEFRAPVR